MAMDTGKSDRRKELKSKKRKMKKQKLKTENDGTLKKIVKRKKELKRDESRQNNFNGEDYTVEEISSEDGDCSRGMKKWILDYHQRRPGLDIIEQRLSEFIAEYEGEQEKARKEREALAAGGGWTVVVHHKGRKKTTDSESGVAVGSVSQAAVQDRMSKQKQKQIALDFYRFQKREAQRNEVMMLQSKFEQDKKRLQQLKAARKFRPY